MAGDWIKMRANLQTHPKVVRISSALKADRLRTVGGLHAVWCLFDEHSEDGCLYGYTPSAVDDLIGWTGFTDLLIAVGWVSWDGKDGLSLPEFDTHNGASAKRRAQEADRKRTERKTAKERPVDGGKPSASDADEMRTREEKRREEKSKDSVAKATGGKPPIPDEEIIFSYGLSMLTSAGTTEKQARSFLGGLRKAHDDGAIVDKLRECLKAKPLQPLEWLAKALPPPAGGQGKPNAQEALEAANRAVAKRFLEKDNHAIQ